MMVDSILSITLISSMILNVDSMYVPWTSVPTSYDAEHGDGSTNADSIVVTGVVDGETIRAKKERETNLINDHETNVDNAWVGSIDYSDSSELSFGNVSLQDIPEVYRGLFWNTSQLHDRWPAFYDSVDKQDYDTDTVFAMDTSDSSDSDELIPGDGDQCCATVVGLYRNCFLENEKGRREVVHLKSGHQHIPIARCARPYGLCRGNRGTCTTINEAITVLVWSPDSSRTPPVELDWFDLPHHCSCQNAVP